MFSGKKTKTISAVSKNQYQQQVEQLASDKMIEAFYRWSLELLNDPVYFPDPWYLTRFFASLPQAELIQYEELAKTKHQEIIQTYENKAGIVEQLQGEIFTPGQGSESASAASASPLHAQSPTFTQDDALADLEQEKMKQTQHLLARTMSLEQLAHRSGIYKKYLSLLKVTPGTWNLNDVDNQFIICNLSQWADELYSPDKAAGNRSYAGVMAEKLLANKWIKQHPYTPEINTQQPLFIELLSTICESLNQLSVAISQRRTALTFQHLDSHAQSLLKAGVKSDYIQQSTFQTVDTQKTFMDAYYRSLTLLLPQLITKTIQLLSLHIYHQITSSYYQQIQTIYQQALWPFPASLNTSSGHNTQQHIQQTIDKLHQYNNWMKKETQKVNALLELPVTHSNP